jgi:hypothetical protein
VKIMKLKDMDSCRFVTLILSLACTAASVQLKGAGTGLLADAAQAWQARSIQ